MVFVLDRSQFGQSRVKKTKNLLKRPAKELRTIAKSNVVLLKIKKIVAASSYTM